MSYQIDDNNINKPIPNNVTSILIHTNKSIDNIQIPNSITEIAFGYIFNQPLDNFKFSPLITKITFKTWGTQGYNQRLDNVKFPTYLVELNLELYNLPLDNVKFPNSLTTLKLCGFNQPLDNLKFPDSLTSLSLIGNFYQPLDNVKFPKSLKRLELSRSHLCGNIMTDYIYPYISKTNYLTNENHETIQQLKLIIEKQNEKINKLTNDNNVIIQKLNQTNELQNEQINDLKKEVEMLMNTIREYHKKN